MHQQFIDNVTGVVKSDPSILGLAVGGSWISGEIDEWSDLDLILVTKEKIAGKEKMTVMAGRLGELINGFTGEHVGEPRVLICLFDNPLLHVDIKFLTPEELRHRVEDPIVVFERDGILTSILSTTQARWPPPDYQWMEDRFWTWVHYAALKLGRGEDFETLDFLASVRGMVLAPLLQLKNGNLPRGLRRVETRLSKGDFLRLRETVAAYSAESLFDALDNAVKLYRDLRTELFPPSVQKQEHAEKRATGFLLAVRKTRLG